MYLDLKIKTLVLNVSLLVQKYEIVVIIVKNPWVDRGLQELSSGHWFDGYQMLLGAYQRALKSNDPEIVSNILNDAIPLFLEANHDKLAFNLISNYILGIRSVRNKREWVEVIKAIFKLVREESQFSRLQNIYSQIITERAFQDDQFLLHYYNIILEAEVVDDVIFDLYYTYAGILCQKKKYVECFEALSTYSEETTNLSARIRTYLTLAEINAYEIGSCGKYLLMSNGKNVQEENPIEARYLEITNSIFRAVENEDEEAFLEILDLYSDLINVHEDILLKVLCDGIKDIFSSQSGAGGLFSLLGG